MRMKPMPTSREGWYSHFVGEFNRTGKPDCATMAVWYLLMMYADGELE